MPYIFSKEFEEFLEIKVPGTLYDRLHKSNWFKYDTIGLDSMGQRYARPGMIVAQLGAAGSYKYVPYSEAASYGTGSDTAVGVLDTFEILTLGDEAIDPISHGTLIEAHCYVYGEDLGNIPAGVKSALANIQWV